MATIDQQPHVSVMMALYPDNHYYEISSLKLPRPAIRMLGEHIALTLNGEPLGATPYYLRVVEVRYEPEEAATQKWWLIVKALDQPTLQRLLRRYPQGQTNTAKGTLDDHRDN